MNIRSGRVIRIGWMVFTTVAATMLGLGGVLFRTEPGRNVVTRYGAVVLTDALNGNASVDSIGGSFFGGLEIWNATIADDDGVLLAHLPHLTLRYRLLDLLSSRVVLGQVILRDPFVNIVQLPSGRVNFEDVLGLGGGDGTGGRPPLVSFRDAEVHNGTLIINIPTDSLAPSRGHEVDTIGGQLMHVRRVEDLNAVLSYVRLVSPFPGEDGQRLDVEELRARVSDPAIDIRDLHGRIDIDGRTLTLDLDEGRLPNSEVQMSGEISWPEGPLLFALDVNARRADVNDVAGLVPVLPWGLTGRTRLRLQSVSADSLRVETTDMDFNAGTDGGRLTGRFGAVVGGDGLAELANTELFFEDLNIDYLRPLLDTIPFSGRLSGRVTADGPTNLLAVELEGMFRDSLAAASRAVDSSDIAVEARDAESRGPVWADWPESDLRGRGVMALGGYEGLVFINFFLDSTDFDLETVRLFAPAVELRGRLAATGTLNGALENAEFAGRLRHEDGDLPVTSAQGVLLLDTRRDTLGLFANLAFDSLRLRGVHPSYPQLPPVGVFGGTLQLDGYADSMTMRTDLQGRAGRFVADAELVLLPGMMAMQNIRASFNRFDIQAFDSSRVFTEFYGSLTGDLISDSTGTHGAFTIAADTSYVADTPVDSVRGTFRFTDESLGSDGLSAWGPAFALEAGGGLGRPGGRREALELRAQFDSLNVLETFVAAVVPTLEQRNALANLRGEASGTMRIDGVTDEYHVALDIHTPELFSDTIVVEGFRLVGGFGSGVADTIRLAGTADSLAWGSQAFSDLQLDLSGRRNASRWFARSRVGFDASAVGWGAMYTSPGVVVLPIDSVRLLLTENVWKLDPGALVSVSDSGIVFRNFTVATADGGRSVELTGILPQNGPGDLRATIIALPVRDVWAAAQRDPFNVGGEIGGEIVVQGTGAAPLFNASLGLMGGRFGEVRIPQLRGTANYIDRHLTGDFALLRGGDSVMAVTLDLPIDLALESVPDRRMDGELRVTASADGVDASLVELVTTNVRDATGRLDFDVGIAGTWRSPELTGGARVYSGGARIPSLGVTHRDMNGSVQLSGDRITVESLSLASGRGTVRVEGFLRLEDLTRPILDVDLIADRFEAIRVPGFLELTATGEVSLEGPLFNAVLTGRTTASPGVLYFADLVQKRVLNLEDPIYEELMDDPDLIRREGLQASVSNRFLDSLRVEALDLTMGSEVWLRSNEANIQLTGQLSIEKTGRTYGFRGALNTPRGVYRLPLAGAGKDFQVTGGDVEFFDASDLNATVDVNAQRVVRTYQQNSLNVFVNLGGTLYDPRLTLTSDKVPAIPEHEIISYLLFNAPSFEAAASGAESRQLGLASLQLGYSAVLGSISGELERALISDLGVPIDYFQIRAAETVRGDDMTNVQIAIGRQIGDSWFVTVSPRLCDDINTVTQALGISYPSVEYRMNQYWRLTASVDPAQPCGVLSPSASDFRPQLGFDILWDRRY